MLESYIRLEEDVPAAMHFAGFTYSPRAIVDRLTGNPKTISALVLEVDVLNGERVRSRFSVLSEKLQQTLAPYLDRERFRDFTFHLTQRGSGFGTDWEIQALPFEEPV